MIKNKLSINIGPKNQEKFLNQNKGLDLKTASFSENSISEEFDFKGTVKIKCEVWNQVKVDQRLAQIAPKSNHKIIIVLMQAGLYSAVKIAALPKQHFISSYSQYIENNEN